MVYRWKREQIEQLIACIQENPCIYNIRSQEYLDRRKKSQAFNMILAEFQKEDGAFTLEEIKRKWRNLRIQYMQELRGMMLSKKSGAKGDARVPKLWCFEQLRFLEPFSEIGSGKSNVKMVIDYDDMHTPSNSQNYYSREPSNKIQKKTRTVDEFRNELDNFKTIIGQRKKESTYAWLGALVVSEMEKISPEDQSDAAWQVQVLMRNLTTQSRRKRNNSSTSRTEFVELSVERISDDDFIES